MLVIRGVPSGGAMRTLTAAAFTLALLISGAAFAQEKANSASDSVAAASAKTLTVNGMVSGDRRTLMTDIDSEWLVSNPDALKGHEGRLVTVKCYVDSEKSRIHVLSVKKDASAATYSARSTDSAFRR